MGKEPIEEINLYNIIYRGKKTPIYVCYDCGEELPNTEKCYVDYLGFTFCDQRCFVRSLAYRDPRVKSIQKDIDLHAPRKTFFSPPKQKYRHLWR